MVGSPCRRTCQRALEGIIAVLAADSQIEQARNGGQSKSNGMLRQMELTNGKVAQDGDPLEHPRQHARPCLAIVNTVRSFHSEVRIQNGHQEADASEILHVMSLGVPQGAEIELSARGPDAEEVLDALVGLFSDNFGFDD
jgi:phosphocarrier protein HPr